QLPRGAIKPSLLRRRGGCETLANQRAPDGRPRSRLIQQMPEVTVATLNLFNRMGDWDSRFPLVVEQLIDLRPDVIAFQEIDLMLDQAMLISREVSKRLPERPHYRMKHAASPGKLASMHGIGTLARIECVEHQVLDLM